MLRSTLLTWKMHRFEVIFGALILAVVGVTVWWVASRLLGLDVPATCWPRDEDGDFASRGCNEWMRRFSDIRYGEGGYVRVALAMAPPLVGIILGVPIVARELELRTTSLAWSLSLRRSSWLLARFLPMLTVGLVGFALLGALGSWLFDALAVGRAGPELIEVAALGPALVARGLLALGIGLLVGAIVGRTMPALLVAVVLVAAWSFLAVPTIQGALAQERAVWVSEESEDWREGILYIAYVDYAGFDLSRPGLPGEPGARFDERAHATQVRAGCGPNPRRRNRELFQAWARCADAYPPPSYWTKSVPQSAFPDFQTAEIIGSMALGAACLLLTFPIVARRRAG